MPLAQAAQRLACCTGVTVAAASVRRATEGAGAAYEAVQTAAVATMERALPPAPLGPRVQWRSVDGAMGPLPHQPWAEGKTLASGTVGPPGQERGEWVVHTPPLSSCSRLAEAATYGRVARVETFRRGTETAKTVWAVRDGVAWSPGVVDRHRPDAVRLLDCPPALSDVAQAGQAVYGEGPPAFTRGFARQRQTWHHGSPGEVLDALRPLAVAAKRRGKPEAVTTGPERLGDLATRRAMLAYAWCDARGYPLGSGSVERANTLVVERRLQGAGMPWARRHVKPRVARRAMACSDRGQEAWPEMAQHARHQTQQARRQRQLVRRQATAARPLATLPPELPIALATAPTQRPRPTPRRSPWSKSTVPQASKGPDRPPPDHPWRRFRSSRRGAQQTTIVAFATR